MVLKALVILVICVDVLVVQVYHRTFPQVKVISILAFLKKGIGTRLVEAPVRKQLLLDLILLQVEISNHRLNHIVYCNLSLLLDLAFQACVVLLFKELIY